MRTTKAIRDKLEKAAAASGRSLAQEVELRLERSFLEQELMIGGLELAYGRQLAGVLLLLGDGIQLSLQVSGDLTRLRPPPGSGFTSEFSFPRNWMDMPFVFDQVVRCVNTILEALRPPGQVKPPLSIALGVSHQDVKRTGEVLASQVADMLLSDYSSSTPELYERAQTLHRLLGPVADRLEQLRLEPGNQK